MTAQILQCKSNAEKHYLKIIIFIFLAFEFICKISKSKIFTSAFLKFAFFDFAGIIIDS